MNLILSVGLLVLMLGISTVVFADAIYLKSGDVVEGNIIQTSEESTTIKTGIRTLKYNASQIERIEKDDGEIVMGLEKEELTDKKRELIKGFLVVNGVEQLIQRNIENVLVKAPAERQAELKEIFKKDILIDLLIPVYAEKFSIKDLEKLIKFFDSPAGKKFVVSSPVIMEETFKVIVDYFNSKSAL